MSNMKNSLSTGLVILTICGLAGSTNAIFAASVGKEFWNIEAEHSNHLWSAKTKNSKKSGDSPGFWNVVKNTWNPNPERSMRSEGSSSFWTAVKSSVDPILKRPKIIDRDGYLSAQVIPQLVVSSIRTGRDFGPKSDSSNMSAYSSNVKPTLKSFLARLEEEREMADQPVLSETVESVVAPDFAESDQVASSQEIVPLNEPRESDSNETGQADNEESDMIHADSKPIFPRPYVQELVEEDLFKYFPVDGGGTWAIPFALGSVDGIFQPPETSSMRSSATIKVEP